MRHSAAPCRRRRGAAARLFVRLLLGAILLASEVGLAQAQSSPFIRRFVPDEIGGGPQCFGILVSPDGLVYAGTQGGLLEFDGQTWRNLTGELGYMAAVVTDAQRRLHVGANGKIFRLEATAHFGWKLDDVAASLSLPRQGSSPFFFAQTDPQDRSLWFSSVNRLVRVSPEGIPSLVHEGGIVRLIRWEDRLLLRSSTGRMLFGWARQGAVEPLAPAQAADLEGISGAVPSGEGGTMALRAREYRMFRGLQPVSEWLTVPGLDQDNVVLSALALSDGRILLGTQRGGVLVLSAQGALREVWTEVDGLTGGGVRAMTPDSQGGVWLATDNGLARVQVDSPMRHYGPERGPKPPIMAMVRHGGRLWAGNAAGAWRQNDEGVFERQRHLPAAVWGFRRDGEDLIVAGRSLVVLRPDGSTERLEVSEGFAALGHPEIDAGGQLMLVPTSGSVLSYRRQEGRWRRGPDLPEVNGSIFDLTFDPQGALWLADSRTKVLRVPWREGVGPAGPVETVALPNRPEIGPPNLAFTVWRGDLWVAGNAGIFRWNPGERKMVRADELGPMAAERQTQMLATGDGALWTFGSTGASPTLTHLARRVVAVEAAGTVRYEVRDFPTALLMPGMTYGMLADDRNELCLFGEGPVGVLVADQGNGPMPAPPSVRIRRLRTPEGTVYEGGLRTTDEPMTLGPGQRSMTLEYTAPWFPTDSLGRSSLEFRSRLVGGVDEWSAWSTLRRREFTNLAPGSYRFEAQARLDQSTEDAPIGHLTLVVPAFWWETVAARVGFLTAGAVLVAAVVRSLERLRLRRRIEVLEQWARVENERLRIARDMHDDLGSSLAHIAVSAQRLREEPPGARAQELAGHIATAARQVMGSARDIIWSVTPQHDTLDALADYLATWVHRACSDAGIECSLDLPNDLPGLTIPGPVRHTVLNVTKEAVQNVLKHAQARRVEFGVQLQSDNAVFTLMDDGQGLGTPSPRSPGSGLGMASMEARMRSVGGRVELQSETGCGTTVKYVLPLPKA